MSAPAERAVSFNCAGIPLVGIVHPSARANDRGILFVVGGGPQYRVGGHRQLVLWSRILAAEGYPVFRFDYRGMGDSHGEFRGYENIDADISAALKEFRVQVPGLREIVLWGECDAAAAILFYAFRDASVKGIVLLNPWARSEATQARTILKYYYLKRVTQRSFWLKLLRFKFNPVESIRALSHQIRNVLVATPTHSTQANAHEFESSMPLPNTLPLSQRLLMGFSRFGGKSLLIMSGRDLIAKEFDVLVTSESTWQEQFQRKHLTRHDIAEADHTFSSARQRNKVLALALEWLRGW